MGNSSTQRSRCPSALLALCGAFVVAACQGPSLKLSSDGPRYVDGRSEPSDELPFRYYGTTVIDVMPADLENGTPDWSRSPVRGEVAMPAPASPWLFPFDLPVELFRRSMGLVEPFEANVETTEAEEPVVAGYLPGGIPALRQRANAARSDR